MDDILFVIKDCSNLNLSSVFRANPNLIPAVQNCNHQTENFTLERVKFNIRKLISLSPLAKFQPLD